MRAILFRLVMVARRLLVRLHRAEHAHELSDEMAFHVELLTRDGIARGLNPEEARAAALRRFGNRTTLAERAHDLWSFGWLDDLLRDVKIRFRGFRRTPTFTVTAVLILGLGIGMATAMFTAYHAVLLRPLPVQDQDRVVVLRTLDHGGSEVDMFPSDVKQLGTEIRTLRGVASVVHWGAPVSPLMDGGQSIALNQARVSGNFFDVLGTRPVLGRLLRPKDDVLGANHVMVLSYRAWQDQFGGDPSIVGHRLTDPDTQWDYTIVGVAPAGLDYPAGVGYWIPSTPLGFAGVDVVARLAPGATLAAARAEFFSIIKRLEHQDSATAGVAAGADIHTLPQMMLGEVRPMLVALSAAVVLLLVIACVNVGNLLLLRAGAREREVAVRRALGASHGAILRQLLIEHGMLAIGGGVLGLLCAEALLRVLVALAPPVLPRVDVIGLAGMPVGVAVVVTAFAVLLFGAMPAMLGIRRNIAPTLRLDARSGRSTTSRRHVRQGLVASQVALAVILLAGAGLLARTLGRLERQPLGYRTDHLSILQLAIPFNKYDSVAKKIALLDQVYARVGALRGISGVTPVMLPPFQGPNVWAMKPQIEGWSQSQNEINPAAPVEIGNADYFHVFGIPILRGRGFAETDREDAPQVAVVSEAFAHRYWPGEDPIGKHFRNGYDPGSHWATVVGIAGDIHYRSLRNANPSIYLPWRQLAPDGTWVHFAVRTTGDLGSVLPAVRREIQTIDPAVSLWRVRTMDEMLDGPLAEPRLSAELLSAFGLIALLLSALGLYGIMDATVQEQTREMGIRLALGATPNHLRRGVIRRALVVTVFGAVFGLGAALVSSRLLANLLFEVSPSDPVTLVSVALMLVVVGVVAAYLPARRATRVDPAQVLRAE